MQNTFDKSKKKLKRHRHVSIKAEGEFNDSTYKSPDYKKDNFSNLKSALKNGSSKTNKIKNFFGYFVLVGLNF